MNKEHLNDFLELQEQIKKEEGVDIKVGDMVSYYTFKAIEDSKDSFNPSEDNYFYGYVKTMKKYLLDKDYK